ncbi:hypothetical protein M2G40_21775 [Vibrio vulnificus]|nr:MULTISPECIES: hypothetical protein [Vibrio]MCU8443759.1 hypothetical protein [Vibrio vulnificus]MCU8492316.1 hypothetical protein [Vibrio vulnificus]MCU8510414.1 hypothetical protein [Vibrio vulnificus]
MKVVCIRLVYAAFTP